MLIGIWDTGIVNAHHSIMSPAVVEFAGYSDSPHLTHHTKWVHRVKVIIPKSGESANNSFGTNVTDTELMNAFPNGSIFSAWDKQLQQVLAIGTMLLAAACATAEARTTNPASSQCRHCSATFDRTV